MQVHVIQSQVTDNYFYLLSADDGSDGLLIDPVDPDAALAAVKAHGITLRYLVNTHGHPDHTRGNGAVMAAASVPLYAHAGDAGWIGAVDHPIGAGERFQIGATTLEVLETPGHTPGHISLYTPGYLFCGDTIFTAGAGNCRFGGDPCILYRTFCDVFDPLPGNTLVYCGHNYAVRNLEFATEFEPDNPALLAKLEEVRAATGQVVTSLAEERSFNPFMRTGNEAFLASIAVTRPDFPTRDPEALFVALRGARDTW